MNSISEASPLAGGCLCGALRYRVTAPPTSCSHCHCILCRKAAGAGFVTWATVPVSAFRFTGGRPLSYRWSPRALRQLCGVCGTQLTFQFAAMADEIDFTCATLDEPARVTPAYHTWIAKKLPWIVIGDTLPQHAEWGADIVPDGV